jgi:hypothetical protein
MMLTAVSWHHNPHPCLIPSLSLSLSLSPPLSLSLSLSLSATQPAVSTECDAGQMADVDEPYLPLGAGLLVPLSEAREQLSNLLNALPAMFAATVTPGKSSLGDAESSPGAR